MKSFITTKRHDHKMFLYDLDYLGLLKDAYDNTFETFIVERMIKKGNIVVDLGANIGYYTLLMAKLVGKTGKVYAFDPDPESFGLLKKNVDINKYKNTILEDKGVFCKNTTARLYIRNDNTAGNSLHKMKRRKVDFFKSRKFVDIETVRLDDYFGKRKIDFIKMDIEGSEYSALRGMLDLLQLQENEDIKILTEFYPELINKVEKRDCADDYLYLLDQLGFNLFIVDENQNSLIISSVEEIMEKCKGRQYVNLYCSRKK